MRPVRPHALATPVAFLIFNRPEVTERVFSAIAQARPRQLLVIADGPRPDRPGEAERCAATRAILDRIDWDCELRTNFADTNLGLKRRVSSGLDWVFEEVEEAIILEDDCLPHPSFFRYCEELLERYRHDERITHINGSNKQYGRTRTDYSYYFTHYHHIWGWATWRRAWQHYDLDMTLWPEIRDGHWVDGLFADPRRAMKCAEGFADVYEGKIETWDYQWAFACMLQGGLAIAPNCNLVSNLGFSQEATHTIDPFSVESNVPAAAMELPLRHPPFMLRHALADAFEASHLESLKVKLGRQALKLRTAIARTRRAADRSGKGWRPEVPR